MNATFLTFIHVLSPLHAGTGQGIGVIDLPIAREKATNLPIFPGSSFKGTLRDVVGQQSPDLVDELFGTTGSADDFARAGALMFSDFRLLCLPVRSLCGTFAWVTSPYILSRFKRDCDATGTPTSLAVPQIDETSCCVTADTKLEYQSQPAASVILEDLDVQIANRDATHWANFIAKKVFSAPEWQRMFQERFCILSDNVMRFLAETATEVTARNRLQDDTKTTSPGALWYEEALPTETILSGVLANAAPIDPQYISKIKESVKAALQLGGHETVGRGLCRFIIDADGGRTNAVSNA